MAIDQGTSNTTRYSSVPMSSSLYFPDSDWSWILVVNANTLSAPAYVISSGTFNAANTLNILASNDSVGWRTNLGGSTADWGGGALSTGLNYLTYTTRRNGFFYMGSVVLGTPSIASEGTGVAISGGTTLTAGAIDFGRRQDGNTARYLSGIWSHIVYSPYESTTLDQMIQVATGNISLLQVPAIRAEELHIEGVTASYPSYTGNKGRHKITVHGSGYGPREEDPLMAKNANSKRFRKISKLAFNTWNGDTPGFDADDGTDLMLTKVG